MAKRPRPSQLVQSKGARAIFDLAPIGMAITSLDGVFIEVNEALEKTLGYGSSDLYGRSYFEICHPDDRPDTSELDQRLLSGEIQQIEYELRYVTSDDRIVHILLKIGVLREDDGTPLHLLGQFVDISKRASMQAHLEHVASHDALTDLPNRTTFIETLKSKLAAKRPFAVLFLDLDQFKLINDSLGHQSGDRLVVEIAQRLREALPPEHMLSRYGGDEFTVLLDGIGDATASIAMASALHEVLKPPFQISSHQLYTSASIGITLAPVNYSSPEEILRDADVALSRAKTMGRARIAVFDETMRAEVLGRMRLERDLRNADDEEFIAYYQPLIDLQDAKIIGFEALVRWKHPQRGLIPPFQFLPIAEESQHIERITRVMLERACSALASWRKTGEQDLYVSVNISARDLGNEELAQMFADTLERYDVKPDQLRAEITETSVLKDLTKATAILVALRELGVQIYVDDFGTGYSSLAQLRRLPVDLLKIDREFISESRPDGSGLEIVRSILSLAESLELGVIAEGVEHDYQAAHLRALGCRYAQGFYYAKPMPFDQASEHLLKSREKNS